MKAFPLKTGFARIELKNSFIRLVDGFSSTPKVNDVSIADQDTTLTIDRNNDTIPVGTRFEIPSVPGKRTITAVVVETTPVDEVQTLTITGSPTGGTFTISFEGQTTAGVAFDATAADVKNALEALSNIAVGDLTAGGGPLPGSAVTITFGGTHAKENVSLMTTTDSLTGGTSPASSWAETTAGVPKTSSITFTPPLSSVDGLPVDNDVLTVSGRYLEIKIGDGDLTYTEHKPRVYDLDRGNLDTVRDDDQAPIDVDLNFVWEYLSSETAATTPTVEEVLKRTGAAAGWTSSASDPCEPYAVDIEVENHPNCTGAGAVEPIEFTTLKDFRYEDLEHSISDASVSVTGRCNVVDATHVRQEPVTTV